MKLRSILGTACAVAILGTTLLFTGCEIPIEGDAAEALGSLAQVAAEKAGEVKVGDTIAGAVDAADIDEDTSDKLKDVGAVVDDAINGLIGFASDIADKAKTTQEAESTGTAEVETGEAVTAESQSESAVE